MRSALQGNTQTYTNVHTHRARDLLPHTEMHDKSFSLHPSLDTGQQCTSVLVGWFATKPFSPVTTPQRRDSPLV